MNVSSLLEVGTGKFPFLHYPMNKITSGWDYATSGTGVSSGENQEKPNYSGHSDLLQGWKYRYVNGYVEYTSVQRI
jgi:hypothetical protein